MSLSRISSASRSETEISRLVADLVPEVVVDRLEAVEVDEQQGNHAATAMQARERLAGAVHQQAAVGQLRQRVVQRLVLEVVRASRSTPLRSVTSLAAAYQSSPSQRALHNSHAMSRRGGESGW